MRDPAQFIKDWLEDTDDHRIPEEAFEQMVKHMEEELHTLRDLVRVLLNYLDLQKGDR